MKTQFVFDILEFPLKKDHDNLHEDLIKVLNRAFEISPIKFTIFESSRTAETQKKLDDLEIERRKLRSPIIKKTGVVLLPYIDNGKEFVPLLHSRAGNLIMQSIELSSVELGIFLKFYNKHNKWLNYFEFSLNKGA